MSKIETVNNLPDSPQQELIKAINQLSEKAGNLDQVLVQFENINQAQRQSIQALAQEISSETTTAIQQQLLALGNKTSSLEQTLGKVEKAADFLEKAQKPIQSAAWKIHESAEVVSRNQWLKIVLAATVAATLTAALVLAGTHGLKRLQQKNETQLQQLLDRATPQEIELIRRIYSRPGR